MGTATMDVLMPQLGETVKEGTVSAWFKRAGDMVVAGEVLFEIETDKTSMEVEALASGRLAEIRVAAGQVVPVGSILAVIAGAGQAAAPAPVAKVDAAATSEANGQGKGARLPEGFGPFSEVRTPTQHFGSVKGPEGVRVTPLARRLIAQNGLDLAEVAAGIRAAGRSKIGAKDVASSLAARARPQAAPARAAQAPTGHPAVTVGARETVPLNRIRQQTGRHLAESWRTAPHVFQAIEIDFSAVAKVRDARKEEFRCRHATSLSVLPFIARGACLALAAYPQVNATFAGDHLVVSRDVHLGIAVDLAHAGLVVPVVRHADGMNVGGLAIAIHRLVESARNGKLAPTDLEGGTYTITNNGSFGTLFTAPIINLPQVAILSTDAIRKKPVVIETEVGDVIVPRPVGVVAQSFDHRAFDGAYSAAFLAKLKEIIERRNWDADFS
jgi:pyruvate/2-oxoglutarate dehydrogenase complex dihydrolipoamide acyltransferase (E2) component